MDTEACIINGRDWVSGRSLRPGRKGFRIATYNVLSDDCIRPGQYGYCPEEIRYMPARHVAIMAEVKEMSPDIICFQEVSHSHFITLLNPSMTSSGYCGILHRRSDDQGLATFWNRLTFELVDQKHSVLHHLAETYLQMTSLSSNDLLKVRESITKPEAVLCVLLRHVPSDSLLAVGNTHVTWSQLKFPALQSLQVSMAAKELRQFSLVHADVIGNTTNSERVKNGTVAQILLGDFNSPPDTIPYRMISNGDLDDVIDDVVGQSSQTNSQLQNDTIDQLRSTGLFSVLPRETFTVKTAFKSAYKTLLGVEPAVTNCDDCGGLENVVVHQLCLDYMWFTPQSLDVSAVLQTPSAELITKYYALPSQLYPSDHIPLLAQFQFLN